MLAVAIVSSMIKKYKTALRHNRKCDIDYCERWFRGEWCYLLSNMDGDYIINSVRKVVQDENANRRNDSKRTSKVHKKINKKSKYTHTEYWKEKKGIKGCDR